MTKYKYGNPEAPIVLIQSVGDHDLTEIEGEVAQIRKLTALDFQMIAVKVDDWNLDLSPWRSPAVFGKEDFGGGAASLLEEILRLCPDEGKTYYLGGYSLAGLFSLWASYQTDRFAGPPTNCPGFSPTLPKCGAHLSAPMHCGASSSSVSDARCFGFMQRASYANL